jgi:hypothetical protein
MTQDTAAPTQAEVEAISRELTEDLPDSLTAMVNLHQHAALMIARLERAWLEEKASRPRP